MRPQERRARLQKEYGIGSDSPRIFTGTKKLGDYFEKVVSELMTWAEDKGIKEGDARQPLVTHAANYLIGELQKLLTLHELPIEELKVRPENFAELIVMVHEGAVSSSGAQKLLGEMVVRGDVDPTHLIEELGLAQVSDASLLEDAAREVIAAHPNAVSDFKKGKEEALKYLVGQMMKETKGAANPAVASDILKKLLTNK